jgi:dienelactone hydrolase
MPRSRKVIAILAAPVVLLTCGAAAGYDYVRSSAFLIQAADFRGPARTVAEWTAISVAEHGTPIPWRGGILRGRVYQPGEVHGPATLLVPGVHAEGIDEPRLVQFARDVAATGRIVITTELPDLKQYRITPRSTDMIEDAARWLSAGSGFAPDGRVGIIGISFAGGLSVVASARPSVRDHVAYVLAFGGHGDLPRTLRYLCTGIEPGGASRPPHDYGIAIILLGVADQVVPPDQAQPLRNAILAYLHASHVDMWDKEQAQIEFARAKEMAESLDQPARTLMRYVNERDVAHLGPVLLPHVTNLGGDEAMNPARSAAPSAPVYLLHGKDDNVVPAIESVLLGSSLASRGVAVHVVVTPLVTHAEVDRAASASDVWHLVRFWAQMLKER